MAPKTAHLILDYLKLPGKLNVDYEYNESKSDDAGTAHEIRYWDDKKASKARLSNVTMLNGKRIVISCYERPTNVNEELDALIPGEASFGAY